MGPALDDQGGVTQGACTGEKSPVVTGSVGANSGPLGTILVPGINAVKAWAAYLNDTQGGLNCHPVKYIVADDGGDPSRHQSLVQRMVEQDGVVAFVQMTAILTGRSTLNYLTERKIPVVGGAGSEDWYYESPTYFPQFSIGPSLYKASAAGIAEFAKSVGKTKVGVVYCVEVSQCTQYADAIGKYGPSYGIEVVYKGAASLAQPDYTANCQAAQAAGAEILYVGLDQSGIDRLAKSCTSVNFRPNYGTTALVTDAARLAANPLLNGVFLTVDSLPWIMTANPGIAEFERVLKKYAPGLTIGPSAHGGWVSAKLFQLAAEKLADPSRSESILAGLWSVQGNDLSGQTYPLQFSQGQLAPPMACYWLARNVDGQWISPNGGQRTCV
jgi:ABC-type branched-subunit amino acid transport system substrate-binding protein